MSILVVVLLLLTGATGTQGPGGLFERMLAFVAVAAVAVAAPGCRRARGPTPRGDPTRAAHGSGVHHGHGPEPQRPTCRLGETREMANRVVDEIERIRTLRPDGVTDGIACSDLDAAAFRAMGVAVTERTLTCGVSEDQEHFWAWATQLYAGATKRRLDPAEAHRRDLFATCFRATAARADGVATAADRHAYYLAATAGGLLDYLCIPLLKALLSNACRRYVAPDGAVLKMFYVKGRGLPYTPVGMGTKRCDNLGDLLWLFSSEVAEPGTIAALEECAELVLRHSGSAKEHGFDVMGDWRAASLRDADDASGIALRAAVVFTMAALTALDGSDIDFEVARSAQHSAVTGPRVAAGKPALDWWFYAPR